MRPLTSLIVPVFNTQDYVGDCLNSVLASGRDDLEIIVVDDASTDRSPEIVDEFAAAHSMIRVIHLATNRGLGNARNEGLRRAQGRWVMFLDSDDLVVSRALNRLATVQLSTDAEMILFDYARTYAGGRVRRSSNPLLQEIAGQEVNFRSRPELLGLLNVAWTKAYRRSFLDRVGSSFPTGYYEDIPWTYSLLVEAKAIRVLNEVVVLYRQDREGRILGTASDRHLDLIKQYRRLFEELQSRGHSEWIPEFFERMADHATFVLGQGRKRLSKVSQEVFYEELTRTYAQWEPADLRPRSGLHRIRHWILKHRRRYRAGYRLFFWLRPMRLIMGVVRFAKNGGTSLRRHDAA